jgi:CRP-like cAMP-binding protein
MHQGVGEKFSKEFKAGEVLFTEGDPGLEMYVVQSGSVRISVAAGDMEKTLAILGPGEFLGEMAVVSGRPRTATATVVEDARLLVFGSDTFETMIQERPEIALRLIRKLAERLEQTDRSVGILLHREPRARVILGLSSLARDRGEERADGVLVRVTPEELADHVGLDVHATLDALKRLERAQLVTPAGTEAILVRSVERVQEYLEYLRMKERFGDL